MERATIPPGRNLSVGVRGRQPGAVVHDEREGVQPGVKSLDTVERGLDDVSNRHLAGFDGGRHPVQGRFR